MPVRAAARSDHSSFFVALPFPFSSCEYFVGLFVALLLVIFDSLLVDISGHKKTPMAEPTGVSRKAQCKPSQYSGFTYMGLTANWGRTDPRSAIDPITLVEASPRSRVVFIRCFIGRAIYQFDAKCQLASMSGVFRRYAIHQPSNSLFQETCRTNRQTSLVEYAPRGNAHKWPRPL